MDGIEISAAAVRDYVTGEGFGYCVGLFGAEVLAAQCAGGRAVAPPAGADGVQVAAVAVAAAVLAARGARLLAGVKRYWWDRRVKN
jgi:hypothetical protein